MSVCKWPIRCQLRSAREYERHLRRGAGASGEQHYCLILSRRIDVLSSDTAPHNIILSTNTFDTPSPWLLWSSTLSKYLVIQKNWKLILQNNVTYNHWRGINGFYFLSFQNKNISNSCVKMLEYLWFSDEPPPGWPRHGHGWWWRSEQL